MNTALEVRDYETLRDQIVQVLEAGKARAQRAVEAETLRTYHEIGHLLDGYSSDNGRADYGAKTVKLLADEVGLSKTLLYQTLAFYRLAPIFHARGKLSWTHYRLLLGAPSIDAQKYYQDAAEQYGWSVRALEAQMKAGAFERETEREIERFDGVKKKEKKPPLSALRGRLYTYPLVKVDGAAELRLDVGFGIYLEQNLAKLKEARSGQRVISTRKGRGYHLESTRERKAVFYSYRARVLSVIDGDTIWLDIDCGFGVWTKQKVRLRGIDAPELKTAEGIRAKDFVEEALRNVSLVGVTTTKPDKYDRYLADIFYLSGEDDPEKILAEGVFLNRAMYEAGVASRFGE